MLFIFASITFITPIVPTPVVPITPTVLIKSIVPFTTIVYIAPIMPVVRSALYLITMAGPISMKLQNFLTMQLPIRFKASLLPQISPII